MFVKILSHPEWARLAVKVRTFCASDPMWLIPADPPTSYGHDLVSSGAKGIPKSSVRKEPRPFIAVLGSSCVYLKLARREWSSSSDACGPITSHRTSSNKWGPSLLCNLSYKIKAPITYPPAPSFRLLVEEPRERTSCESFQYSLICFEHTSFFASPLPNM